MCYHKLFIGPNVRSLKYFFIADILACKKGKAQKEERENKIKPFLICDTELMANFQCQEEKVKNVKLFN